MNRSRYENRAKEIHGSRYKTQAPKDDIPAGDYWRDHVRSRADVIDFYRLYYPYLPEVLVLAVADHIQKQIDGTIPPSEHFYKDSDLNKVAQAQHWDFKKDLEEQRTMGKINVAIRRMDELMMAEEEEAAAATQPQTQR